MDLLKVLSDIRTQGLFGIPRAVLGILALIHVVRLLKHLWPFLIHTFYSQSRFYGGKNSVKRTCDQKYESKNIHSHLWPDSAMQRLIFVKQIIQERKMFFPSIFIGGTFIITYKTQRRSLKLTMVWYSEPMIIGMAKNMGAQKKAFIIGVAMFVYCGLARTPWQLTRTPIRRGHRVLVSFHGDGQMNNFFLDRSMPRQHAYTALRTDH